MLLLRSTPILRPCPATNAQPFPKATETRTAAARRCAAQGGPDATLADHRRGRPGRGTRGAGSLSDSGALPDSKGQSPAAGRTRVGPSVTSTTQLPPLASPSELGLQPPGQAPASVAPTPAPAQPASPAQAAPAPQPASPAPSGAAVSGGSWTQPASCSPTPMKELDRTARFAALGGIATIAVTQPEALALARATVQRTVADFDLACSRFRQDSELAALNRAAGTPVRVSPLFLEALQAGLRAARLTDGDVDPTIGNMLIELGYDRDFAAVQARTDGPATIPRPAISPIRVAGWRTVVLDARAGTARLPPGVTLDLGATAKALAADRAAQSAHEAAGCGVLVSLSRRHRGRGPCTAGRLASPGDRRSSIRLRCTGAMDRAAVRRPRHIQHDRPPLAASELRSASSARSRHGSSRSGPLANGRASPRLGASMPTSRLLPRSSAAPGLGRGSSRFACRAAWSPRTAPSHMRVAGLTRAKRPITDGQDHRSARME